MTLEVTKQEKEEVRVSKEYDEPDNNSEINFDIMPVEDIARKLSYACSYIERFEEVIESTVMDDELHKYLVDGAMLTCTQATTEPFSIKM